ncbi:MAG: AAA family ATPase [Actinobacteria bacterium]|nr:AAA family ATPase [Actinomycetota bacterium]
MVVRRLWVERYRSLVELRLDLHPVTVIQGENATGKTNVYRALGLLSRGAAGELARSLLEEGGMPSALAAIPPRGRKPGPVRLRLGVAVDDFSYELALGLPSVDPATTRFALDAEIKEEAAWFGPKRTRHSELLDRSGATASAKDVDGATVMFAMTMDRYEPALSQLGEPARFPELFALRERLRSWRFYHQIPTGPDAPARFPRSGVRTPVMSNDGRDLAAALATIVDMGNGPMLDEAIDDGFPGSSLVIDADRGVFGISLSMPGLLRPMAGHELSDGTLRYLALTAALLSPRPPEVLVLNEPETSLHPSLIEPLARLITAAADHSQLIVTTHSMPLAEHIQRASGYPPTMLQRLDGATAVTSRGLDHGD